MYEREDLALRAKTLSRLSTVKIVSHPEENFGDYRSCLGPEQYPTHHLYGGMM